MPASKPSRRQRGLVRLLKVTLRHGLIHALNVVLYLFMAVLVAVAGLLVFLLSRDDIPLPDFVLRRIEARLAQAGVEASFSRARLDLHGNVLINDLRLEPSRFGEPVIEADVLYLDFDELFLAAGMIELAEVQAEGVTFFCPSTLSPSGERYPWLRIAGLSVERAGRAWRLNGALAESGQVHLTVHGTFTPPIRSEARRLEIKPDDVVEHYARLAPRIARVVDSFRMLEHARVEAAFAVSRTGEVQVQLEATARSVSRPDLGHIDALRIRTELSYADGRMAPFEVRAEARDITRPDGITVIGPAVLARWERLENLRHPEPSTVTASAARIVHPKLEIQAPVLEAATGAFPRLDGRLCFTLAGEPLEVRIAGDASSRDAAVEVRGRFGRDWLAEGSRIQGRDLTYYATIDEPPDFWARIALAQGRWQHAEFRGIAGPIVARGVALDRARIHGFATPEGVVLDHLEIAAGSEGGIGTYTDTFATRDHRLLLHGNMRPHIISPWFSGWWERFWADFTFDGPPPVFDIDVAGNWTIPGSDVVRGRGRAERGTMRGIPYESLETSFFVRMNYYDLYQATIVRPEGRVTGEVQLLFRPSQRDAARTSFSFESTADLVELARIFGPGGEALLAPYRYTVPPHTRVSGVVTNDAGAFDTTLDIQIESPAEFRYHDFPVATISTEVKIHNTRVDIPRLLASYGGGTLRASAVADNGKLAVKASLDNALYDEATGIFNDFLDRKSPPPPGEADPAGLTARPPGGRLSLGVEATGPITTFDAYEGTGSLRISEANLGSVRIFGLLSDLMGSINPKLGSLRFSEANTPFVIARDRVFFPSLRITGRTAALETEGTYFLNSKNLDFKARLYPLGESGNAITQLFDFVLGPVSYLLEMRLTGTLRKPHWSLSRIPFAPKPVVDEGTPSTPATGGAETTPEAVEDFPTTDAPSDAGPAAPASASAP